jgi:hypothetical protein
MAYSNIWQLGAKQSIYQENTFQGKKKKKQNKTNDIK